VDPFADLSRGDHRRPRSRPQRGSLTYTLTAANAGPDSAAAVSLTLPLPDNTDFVSAGTGCTVAARESSSDVPCGNGRVGATASRDVVVKAHRSDLQRWSATVTPRAPRC
jgi:hypothetical protein